MPTQTSCQSSLARGTRHTCCVWDLQVGGSSSSTSLFSPPRRSLPTQSKVPHSQTCQTFSGLSLSVRDPGRHSVVRRRAPQTFHPTTSSPNRLSRPKSATVSPVATGASPTQPRFPTSTLLHSSKRTSRTNEAGGPSLGAASKEPLVRRRASSLSPVQSTSQTKENERVRSPSQVAASAASPTKQRPSGRATNPRHPSLFCQVSVTNLAGVVVLGPVSLQQPISGHTIWSQVAKVVNRPFKLLHDCDEVTPGHTLQTEESDNVLLTVLFLPSYSVVTWGDPDAGGDSSCVSGEVSNGVTSIVGNHCAFAAICGCGKVVTWGRPERGGTVVGSDVERRLESGVASLHCNESAFAAIKETGEVVTWGRADNGGDSRKVARDIAKDIVSIASTSSAFAALKNTGAVVTWGRMLYGGNSAEVAERLESGVQTITSNAGAFAAVKEGGEVVAWGDPNGGGSTKAVLKCVAKDVKSVSATLRAFAGVKKDGSVVTWGAPDFGGTSRHLANQLKSCVKTIVGAHRAFAAIKDNGSVVVWGEGPGADISLVSNLLQKGVVEVVAGHQAFAALKRGGSVVSWGFTPNFERVEDRLQSGVCRIVSNGLAFAALKEDGSVITWGMDHHGGDSKLVAHKLSSEVKTVVGNSYAFVAIKESGEAVAWGTPSCGGELGLVADSLAQGIVSVSSTFRAFAALKEL